MSVVVLRRWLKVADPTALTARETLQRGLGLGRAVEDVNRSELVLLRWDGSREPRDAVDRVRRLASGTNLLLNPNKHFLEVRAEGEPLTPRGNQWVMVWRPGEGAGLEETLRRRRLVGGEAPAVRSALLWELALAGDAGERRERAESITRLRSRQEGLLANPELQDARIFDAAPTAAGIAAALFS
jgi:hypothetical protein